MGNTGIGNFSNPPFTISQITGLQTALDKYRKIIKQVDESRNNTIALTNDSELFLTVEANTIYKITVLMILQNAVTAAGFRYTISAPSGSSSGVSNSAPIGNSTNITNNLISTFFNPATSTTGERYAGFTGYLKTGGSAGVLYVQWAQNVSDAGLTTVKQGSFLELIKE